ncbi:ComF family protein [Gilvimarinus sp. DA14]|uniref:ComF family protein n=1 Tax=Gilvimarinus sp. DA14 TaxID=2956798 RepID=UPI0020B89DF3|nr:ComF family protein [Gilvimarinus sp. DA14]UTF59365.1 ComF family protein [Gilvimarinus sp. DA14]
MRQLHTLPEHACCRCALPLDGGSRYCGRCLAEPPAFSHSLIAFHYQFPLDYLIGRFKFERCLTSAHWLALQFQHHLRQHKAAANAIVPVPMHWRSLVKRGFDQTLWLARAASKTTHVPVRTDILQKIRHSPALHGLSRKDRMLAIRGAYRAAPVSGLHLALVDDIVTTTTTSRTLSKLLIRAGAASVQIWALARTPEH